MNDWDNAVQEMLRILEIKKETDNSFAVKEIGDIVDSLSEKDAKTLLKLYIYSR